MPRIDVEGLDELIADTERFPAQADKKIDAMLLAGAEEVKKGWQQAASENDYKDTGEMIAAIGYTQKPKKLGELKYIEIYPLGSRSRQPKKRHAEVAYVLHWGTTGRTGWRAKLRLSRKKNPNTPGIPGSHWVDRAEEISESPRVKAMVDVWKKED